MKVVAFSAFLLVSMVMIEARYIGKESAEEQEVGPYSRGQVMELLSYLAGRERENALSQKATGEMTSDESANVAKRVKPCYWSLVSCYRKKRLLDARAKREALRKKRSA